MKRIDAADILARAQWAMDKSRVLRAECELRGRDAFGLRLGAQQAVAEVVLVWDDLVRQRQMWKRAHLDPTLRVKTVVDLNAWRTRRRVASAR